MRTQESESGLQRLQRPQRPQWLQMKRPMLEPSQEPFPDISEKKSQKKAVQTTTMNSVVNIYYLRLRRHEPEEE